MLPLDPAVLIKDHGFALDAIKRPPVAVCDVGIRGKMAKVNLVTITSLSCVGLAGVPRLIAGHHGHSNIYTDTSRYLITPT